VRGAVIVPLQQLVVQGAPLQSVTLDVNGQQHALERASIASCQNNLNPQGQQTANCVMKFQGCTTHANAVTPASMVNPAALTTPNGQLLLDTNPAEEMTIVGVRQTGPNNAVVVARNVSSRLMLHCANGKHYSKATIVARKAGRGQQEFLKVTMSEVFITSYQANADGSVSIGMKYSMADGSLAGFQDLH
jgi:Type VI secretion system effector, Hcp